MSPFLAFLIALSVKGLVWCRVHPLIVAGVVTSVVSSLYDRLAKYPRVHAAFQVLAGFGFDVPKIADGLSRLLSGNTVDQAKVNAVELAVEALIPVHVQPPENSQK